MGILISVVLPLALAFIMFSLGLSLVIDDFKRVLVQPLAFLTGLVSQMALVPFMSLVLVVIFGLPPELAVGVMILSFCPGGVTSNIISQFARGDVALSVSLTAVISLIGIMTIPFLVAWSMDLFMGAEAPPITIAKLALSVFLITTLPVAVGILVRHLASAFAQAAEPVLNKIATALFAIIVIAALASNWETFIENIAILGPILVALNIVLLVLGVALATLAGLTFKEVKTIAVETGVQNSTVGITLGAIVGGQAAGFSAFALPSAVYGITMYLITLPVVFWLRSR